MCSARLRQLYPCWNKRTRVSDLMFHRVPGIFECSHFVFLVQSNCFVNVQVHVYRICMIPAYSTEEITPLLDNTLPHLSTPCEKFAVRVSTATCHFITRVAIVRPFLKQSDSGSRKRPFSTGFFWSFLSSVESIS